ncbi:MAG: elongation factor P [Candidatus Omnitrophota bacterium]
MGQIIKATEVRVGNYLEFDGEVYVCTKYEHHAPGKGQAVCRLKFKHLKSGRVLDKTVKSGEGIERAVLEPRQAQFLYRDDELHFMDINSFEQFSLPPESFLGKDKWLKENMELTLRFHNGEPVDVDMPTHLIFEVAETNPGYKGDTVTGATKPATLENGAVIQVPLFVNAGDKIKIDTEAGTYLGRG